MRRKRIFWKDRREDGEAALGELNAVDQDYPLAGKVRQARL